MIHLDLSLIVSGSRLIIHIQLNWSSEYTHFHNLLKLTVSVHFSGLVETAFLLPIFCNFALL